MRVHITQTHRHTREKIQASYSTARLSWLTTFLVGGPKREVVPQELHYECRILVRILCDIVQLSDRIFESLARHLAGFIRIAQHFVLEHREVQRKTQTNWMRHDQVLLCYLGCFFVRLPRTLSRFSFGIAVPEFSH